MALYRIANWELLFETHETRKLLFLKWVPTPNKHDGLGFRRVASQPNRCELFAAWNLILQVASKGRKITDRGTLQRDGRPLTPDDFAMMTGFPAKIFESALVFFSSKEMGWLEVVNQGPTGKPADDPGKPAESPESPGSFPAEGKGRNGIEGNGRTLGAAEEPLPTSDKDLSQDDWLKTLSASPAYEGIDVVAQFHRMNQWCLANNKHPTRRRFTNWLNRCDQPIKNSPTAIDYSKGF